LQTAFLHFALFLVFFAKQKTKKQKTQQNVRGAKAWLRRRACAKMHFCKAIALSGAAEGTVLRTFYFAKMYF